MSSVEQEREAAIQEREKDRDLQQAAELADLHSQNGDVDQLRELIESELHPGTVRTLDNYLSRDFILGKNDQEDREAFRWRLRRRVKWAIWNHPPEEGLTGRERVIAYNDKTANLPALSHTEKLIMYSYADGIAERYGRSEDGFQQKEMTKQRSVVERKDTSNEQNSRLGGWL